MPFCSVSARDVRSANCYNPLASLEGARARLRQHSVPVDSFEGGRGENGSVKAVYTQVNIFNTLVACAAPPAPI